MQDHAELIVVPPAGKSAAHCRDFIGRCVVYGVDFYFEEKDELPCQVPAGVRGVRAVALNVEDAQRNAAVLRPYTRNGARVYLMGGPRKIALQAWPNPWQSESTFHQILFDAGLTTDSRHFRERMGARADGFVFEQLGERLLATRDLRWYDVLRYHWEGLLDGYEITGDRRFLTLVREQASQAIKTQPNDLSNCDRVAPLIPLLRLHQLTGGQHFLRYAVQKFDRYLAETPKYRGGFVNFRPMTRHVRNEIVFQVCPGLMLLARATGKKGYREIALDQFEKLRELLHCRKTGLWHHGVGDGGRSAAFWARGTAYVFLAILQLVEALDEEDRRRRRLMQIFQRMAARIRDLQDRSGFWFAVVDDPETERESSGTAWIAATMERGLRQGCLDHSFRACADAAWQAVKSRVWQGDFPGHSSGTTVSSLSAYYNKKNLNPMGWPHFAFRAACERQRTRLTIPRESQPIYR